ncbi:hypothetical protein ACHIPZ_06450 [Antrihabitans sp. NCIMB 15449]|uniref:Uncharacterized protein n=1 Tax=Antrihabitans spumae TaxID=3373370 RepID=A0ABW7JJC3_9NOCA
MKVVERRLQNIALDSLFVQVEAVEECLIEIPPDLVASPYVQASRISDEVDRARQNCHADGHFSTCS